MSTIGNPSSQKQIDIIWLKGTNPSQFTWKSPLCKVVSTQICITRASLRNEWDLSYMKKWKKIKTKKNSQVSKSWWCIWWDFPILPTWSPRTRMEDKELKEHLRTTQYKIDSFSHHSIKKISMRCNSREFIRLSQGIFIFY